MKIGNYLQRVGGICWKIYQLSHTFQRIMQNLTIAIDGKPQLFSRNAKHFQVCEMTVAAFIHPFQFLTPQGRPAGKVVHYASEQ